MRKALLAALALIVFSGAAAAQQWGAIAVDDQTGDSGWSYRWNSEQQARSVAINMCKRQGRNNKCQSVYAFQGSCTALIHGGDDNYVGAGASEKEAVAFAMGNCAKEHKDCEFSVSLCSWSQRQTE